MPDDAEVRRVPTDSCPLLRPDGGSVGLVGLGLVGQALAVNLLRAGWRVRGFDVRTEACVRLRELGGLTAENPQGVFSNCHVTLLSLPTDDVVADVLDQGSPPAGHCVIDTSTGDPAAAVAQHSRLQALGVAYIDAPLSGSSQQLAERQAVFLVGTSAERFEWLRPLFAALADQVFHTGDPGSAARLKLVTNLVLGLNRAALAEGLHFARALGLDPGQTLHILQNSAAASRIMEGKGAKMLARDYRPQARLAQHLKDVRLMLAAGGDTTPLPLTRRHAELLELAVSLGWGDHDNSALLEALPHWPPDASTDTTSRHDRG